MPRAFTEHEKNIIRQRLLEQGYQQFSAHGLKKTNVEELSDAAGISKGAFYLFYASKEMLFMDVVELAEQRFRQEVLATVNQPGSSPRARLAAILKTSFTLWKTIPVLKFFTSSDYEILYRRVPVEKIQEHLASDRQFMDDLISHCQAAGIPFRVPAEQVSSLMYALFLCSLHADDLGPEKLSGALEILVNLVAAFCLGEAGLEDQPFLGRERKAQ